MQIAALFVVWMVDGQRSLLPLISMKQGEKTQKIVAKYVYDRFRERDRRVKYNLV